MTCFRSLGSFIAGAASVLVFNLQGWSWPDPLTVSLSQTELLLPASSVSDSVMYILSAVVVVGLAIWGARRVLGLEVTGSGQASQSHRDAFVAMELLNAQIRTVLNIISEHSVKNDSQLTLLDGIRRETDAALSTIEVKRLVGRLAALCIEATQNSKMLREKLSVAQCEAEGLKLDLSKARSLAEVDALTGVANRRSFDEQFAAQVVNHHASKLPICLLLVDIDHFKKVNDVYGHQTGDMVIKQFVAVIAQSVRSTDFIARYGGEEFAVVLPRTSLGNARAVAERIRQALPQSSWSGILPASARIPTGSFGIAEGLDGETPAQLFERADRMLYSAKRLGRDRVEYHSAAGAEHACDAISIEHGMPGLGPMASHACQATTPASTQSRIPY